MRQIIFEKSFKKDFKLTQKRGKDIAKFKLIMDMLADAQDLPVKYHDHMLKGNWKNHRECHIEPDWLLIYRIEGNNVIFIRTGSHADLFK